MNTRHFYFLLSLVVIFLLSGCQSQGEPVEKAAESAAEAVQEEPTTLPDVPTAIPASPTLAPTDTPVPTPTEVPTATPEPTITLSPEFLVTSIDDLVGTWKGYWSDQNLIFIEFTPNGILKVGFEKGQIIASGDVFTLQDSLLTITTKEGSDSVSSKCLENPTAVYQAFLTRRGDVPIQLRFELQGEDYCFDRKEFMAGKVVKWVANP